MRESQEAIKIPERETITKEAIQKFFLQQNMIFYIGKVELCSTKLSQYTQTSAHQHET